jgi:hypothetical protein
VVCHYYYTNRTHIFEQTINSEQYVHDILGPFLAVLWMKKRHCYFMQDGATAHTINYSVDVLNEVFEDKLIRYRL